VKETIRHIILSMPGGTEPEMQIFVHEGIMVIWMKLSTAHCSLCRDIKMRRTVDKFVAMLLALGCRVFSDELLTDA